MSKKQGNHIRKKLAASIFVALILAAATFVPVGSIVPDEIAESISDLVPDVVEGRVFAETADAHETQTPAVGGGVWHPWTSDGCSNVPNWQWGVFNFTHACQHHDGCYRNHWADRYTCDQWFLNDMYASCGTGDTWGVNRWTCRAIARTYYWGVRNLGVSAYYGWTHTAPLA